MAATQSFLKSGETFLRGFGEADLSALALWWDDCRVTEFLEMGARPTRPKELQEFWDVAGDSDSAICFAICATDSGQIIGTCGLYQISWIARRAQFNILIGDPESWDRGHGTRATELTLAYGFDILNLNSINLGVNANNERAIRSYEKAGFVAEGVRRQFIFRNARFYDMAVFSILRDEYNARLQGSQNG